MSFYSFAKFVHIASDIGIFIGIGAQLLSLAALRQIKRAEQARVLLWLITTSDVITIVSAALTITAGLYMALTIRGLQISWIAVSLGSLVALLLPLIRVFVEPRMRAIVKMTRETPDGPLPQALEARIHDPILGTALQMVAAVVFGIVFLMTVKPSLVGALIGMLAALALGLVSGLPLWFAARRRSTIRL